MKGTDAARAPHRGRVRADRRRAHVSLSTARLSSPQDAAQDIHQGGRIDRFAEHGTDARRLETITPEQPARYRRIHWREFRALRAAGDYADIGEEVQISRYRRS
jgi:hypothetical protein